MPVETNWEFWLVAATLICGLIILAYWLLARFKGKKPNKGNDPFLLEYAKSFFPILLFVVILRSFIVEPFRIPSGSMIPTLEIGDFILVKKYAYGLRLPVLHTKILETSKPERGDVVVFRFPPNPKINYIKRLIGMPGDKIRWTKDKRLFINDKLVQSNEIEPYETLSRAGKTISVKQINEKLTENKQYNIIHFPHDSPLAGEWEVPADHYFTMGDNRDNSSDSRVWRFVPEKNLVGKASMVWLHWNWQSNGDGFQTERIGTAVE